MIKQESKEQHQANDILPPARTIAQSQRGILFYDKATKYARIHRILCKNSEKCALFSLEFLVELRMALKRMNDASNKSAKR
jgi:hypothetical protein